METVQARAFSLGSEIPLESVARHFGIARRSRWEDYLELGEANLAGVLQEATGKSVHLFPFGCMCTFGMAHHEAVDLVAYLRRLEPKLQDPQEPYIDDCRLEIGASSLEIRDDSLGVPELKPWMAGILSTVLSKSVALERVEVEIADLIDEVEPVVQDLATGSISPSDTKISRLAGRILSFRIDTVAYIQLLDKPDAAWDNHEAEDMYGRLAQFFELHDRYEKIQAKSGVLMDLTEVVTTYAHHNRGMRLEWAIILLIVFEILLSLFQMFVMGRG